MKNVLKEFCIRLKLDWQFIKFLFVGGLNTLFGYGVFALCTFLGCHYTLSTLIATILGILFNFKTTGIIVFKNSNNRLLLKFLIVYGIVYLFTTAALKLLITIGSSNMYINYAILLLPNALLTFALMKKFVFN